jgi:hypothetical protein
LLQALKDAVSQLNGKLMDFGWTTTPQLHYITLCLNTVGTPIAYGEPSENGYYKKLSTAFINVMVILLFNDQRREKKRILHSLWMLLMALAPLL